MASGRGDFLLIPRLTSAYSHTPMAWPTQPLTNGAHEMTISFRRIVTVFIAASAVTWSAGAATAGESGSFTLLNSFVHDYTVLEHAGETVAGGPLQGTATVIESSGSPFAEYTRG